MPSEGFEPTISAGELPQTHSLDRAATGIGMLLVKVINLILLKELNSGHTNTHTHHSSRHAAYPAHANWASRLIA
jgi:hypothetical protein